MSRKLPPAVDPPANLSPKAQELWRAVQRQHCRSIGRRVVLELALQAYDRAAAAKAIVDAEGAVAAKTRGKMVHMSPHMRVQAEATREFVRLWTTLNLTWDAAIDGR